MKDLTRFLLFIGIVEALLFARCVSATTCYFPDGSIAGAHTPCTDGQQSACCYNIDDSHHDLCFSNGMCMSLYWGYLYRGSCTDSTFRDPSCPNRCVTGNGARTNDTSILTHCEDGNIRCGTDDDATICSDNNEGFQWDNATILADYYGIPATAAASATASSCTAVSTTTIATVADANKTVTAAAGEATKDQETCSSKTGLEIGLGVGLGVGLGLPLILVSTALALLLAQLRRERSSGHRSLAAENPFNSGTGGSVKKELSGPDHPPQRPELQARNTQELEC